MWKNMVICSSLLMGCKDWHKNPDGPMEEFIESVIEAALQKGAALVGIDVEIKIDFTPESPEPPVRSEELQEA